MPSTVTAAAHSPTSVGPSGLVVPSVDLRRGTRSEAVRQLQRALIALGELPAGSADAIFGPRTEAAVKRFQFTHRIRPTGFFGPLTRGAMRNAMAQAAPVAPAPDPSEPVGFRTLWPMIQAYGHRYGADPRVLAAIVAQESSFVNYRVHRDGTGHGLIGLDDNGLLRDFERWSGYSVGRGHNARVIPPELQIEYLAKTVGAWTQRYGSSYAAARAWHRGTVQMADSRGRLYERLVHGRMRELFA